MNNENVFICLTIRHLFFAICISLTKKVSSTIIYCTNHQPLSDELVNFEILEAFNIRIIRYDETSIYAEKEWLQLIPYIGRHYSFSGKKLKNILNETYQKFEKVGLDDARELYVFHDRSLLTKAIIKRRSVKLIEDGLANYRKQKIKPFSLRFFYRMLKGYSPFNRVMGEDKNVSEIYLSNPALACPEVKNKVKDLKYEYSLNESLLSSLINVFHKSNGIDEIENNAVIILTQPLDWAGFCSNEKKVDIYKILVNILHHNGCDVYIKPHPRENMEQYKCIFNAKIISQKLPLEVLSMHLSKKNIEYYSLYSSSEYLSDGEFKPVTNLIEDDSDWLESNLDSIVEIAIENIKKHTKE
ncbi:hypothetical protein GTW31_13550 [Vibrio parahaemolyticus]|nr:hypothetical protein [Vibrio parahaemolyticus]EGR2698406.1 hypothetical protein [Vibrio parahaemolyticus]EJE4179830.1 hypothetical protein [Vibrio parahaemolyticus]MDG3416817.1 glycosyltransferase family 52 [Vibrio parahaemolyticus]HBC3541516.1 hypothetical protein [Vibrio parahaemolyticus]